MQTSIISEIPKYNYNAIQESLLLYSENINENYYFSNRLIDDWKSWIGNSYLIESMEDNLQNYLLKIKSSALTLGIEKLLFLLMGNGILILNSDEIRNYLLQHQDIVWGILPICDKIREKFRHSAEITIALYMDNEINDSYLVVYVRQAKYIHNIMDIIDQINDDSEMLLKRKSGWLLITTDFKPPTNT